ncbi:MAG: pteridine reductase [Gallionellales bacterium 35-53-114]|nr:MAG: pteridine reductase [Gallionellales bacterium 35-53-114]OYZ64307.1 MAG: pteridine reductase [Gallionellales bacterium 24-53-125]OZB10385.1 MAG: pteridine reductase [Gallionellales bacterium 39-52-133]HQS56994.1 pteridine reductase [Gallionellaceae bacterium]HQS75222.1 pteridine reductase [Gallionellaceae bacterium]
MQGKVILVTGGAKRVGAAISRRLHAAGANIALHYRSSAQEALTLQAELNAKRADSVLCVQADLLDMHDLPGMVTATVKHFGRLDGLVNNASSFYATTLAEVDETHWSDLLGTNLKAPLFLAQAAEKELRKHHGAIVNIVDIHAERPMQGHLVYSVAKAGLVALTKALAQELAPQVRVNAVAPGVIIWPEQGNWENEERRRQIVEHTLLKREGEPDDIAKTVQFLLGSAPYITGQVIAVDGGRSINL